MLSLTILTLLITSNVISRIQAEEQEERKSQLSGTPTSEHKSDRAIEALKIQKRDTLNIVPESYVEETNHVDESQHSIRRRRDLNLDNFMPDLSKMGSFFNMNSKKTGGRISYGSQVNQKDNIYAGDDSNGAIYGARDVNIGNTYSGDSDGPNAYGPTLLQENNVYQGKNNNAQYGASVTQIGNKYPERPGKKDIYTGLVIQTNNTYSENPGNGAYPAITVNQSNNTYPKSVENNKDALKPMIYRDGNFYPSRDDSEARMNTHNNKATRKDFAERRATVNQGKSSSTNYDSRSHEENKARSNKERESYAEKHSQFNRQMSLSSNAFYSVSYSLILLFKYSVFEYLTLRVF